MRVRILSYGCICISLITNGMQKPKSLLTPTLTKKVHVNLPKTVTITPAGTQVIVGAVNEDSAGQLYVFDAALDTQKVSQFGYAPVAAAAAVAPNSQTVCISNEYGAARIVTIASGQTISIAPDGIMPTSVEYSNDGTQVLMATPNGVYQLDVASNTLSAIISGYCQSRVAYYKPDDNSTIAVTQEVEGSAQNGVQLYNIKANKSIRDFKPKPEPVYQLAFNATGDKLVCGQVSYLSVWDTSSGQEAELLNGAGKLVSKPAGKKWGAAQIIKFLPGKNIFFAPVNSLVENGAILACDIDTPANNIRFGQLGQDMSKCVTSVAVSPDGQALLVARELGNDVSMWDISALTKSKQSAGLCDLL